MKLGFVGSGKMASALLQGVVQSGALAPGDLIVSDVIAAAAVPVTLPVNLSKPLAPD